MKKHLKRLLSLMMAVLLCIGVMPSSAFAASYDYDGYISMIDHNTRGYSLSSNLPAPFGGYSSNKFTELRINDLKAFRTAYCIQFSVGVHTGIGYDQSDDYAAFTAEQKSMINTALTLGYNVETGTKYGGSAIDEYIATQILIWLIAHEQLGTGYETQIVNEFTVNSPAAKPIFYQLRENVVNYHTIPSFATDDPSAVGAYTHALKYNESNGKNETTLVDENNVLGNFAVSYPGVDFSVSGNELHVSTSETEFGTITAEKRLPSSVPGVVTGGTKYWLRDEYQNVVTFDVEGSAEPVKCCFSLEIKAGALQLVKTSEDGKVEGIPESTPVPEDEAASSSQPEASAESEAPAEPAGEPSSESSPAPESEPEPAPSASIVPQLVPAVASLASKASVLPLSTTSSSDEVQIEQPEEGAEFQVYLASAGSYGNAKETERDLLITDSYGFARSKDLPYGLYVVHQTAGAEGQKFVPDFSVFISKHGKTYYYILNNPTFTSLIRFEKKDLESGKIIPLAGTAVKIRNTDTGEWVVQHLNYPSPIDIDTFVTDSTGTLMLPEPLPFGNYELYEQQSPWGYVFDGEPVPFVVDGTQDVITVEKYNIAQKGTITVSKEGEVFSHVAEAGGLYQPQYEVQGQPGAVYDVTALEDIVTPDGTVHLKAGELAATLTTGSDGTATSEPLYLGRYQILERTAPDGMVIDPEPKEVTLSYAGQEVEITSASVGFVNERQKVEISLQKLLEQDEIFSIGMNEEWKNITFGLFAAEELTAADGTSIPADGLIETIGVDENGNAIFKTDVPCGASLYVKEIGTDEHYILSDEKYPVVFEYAGQDIAKVQIQVNDGEPIENTLKRGKVSGWKVDQDGFELGGAVIGLFRFDETEFTEETAFLVTESNEIGYFEFDKVPVGNWLVREIAPPAAFVLTEETFPVEITEDGQTIEIRIENQIIKGIAETTKVDADYPENKLSGAVFEIYADVDNNGEFDAEIDQLVGEMTETEPGLYQMKDLVWGSYFLHEKESPEFFQRDENYYPFSITENGAVVRIETEAGVGFLNKAQTGSLKVVKTADDDKIEGRTFKITGTDFMGNPYEQEFQTDENGEINVELRVGEYTVAEAAGEDAEKYILPDDQTVGIKAGETTTVKMHNKLVPEVPTVPQTGDNPWMPALLGALALFAALSGGALLFLHHTGKKRKAAGGSDEDQGAEE